MNNFHKDKNEYQNLRDKNFNQLDTFYNSFIRQFGKKLDSEYITLIKRLYQMVQDSRPKELPIGYKEYFRKYIHFHYLNNDFYTIIWDIELAKKIIKSKNLQPKKIRVRDLLDLVDSDSVDNNKLIKAQKKS